MKNRLILMITDFSVQDPSVVFTDMHKLASIYKLHEMYLLEAPVIPRLRHVRYLRL